MLPTKLSIRKFFYLFLFCAVIAPLLIVGGISLYISSTILRKEILESNLRRVSFYSDKIEHYLDTPRESFEALVRQLETGLVDPEIMEELIFKPFVESSDIILSIQKANSQGIIDAIYPPDELFLGLDISGHQYFKVTTESKKPYWSPSSLSEHMDSPVTSLSYYLNGSVITATLSLEEVTSLFKNQKFYDEGLILYVTDQKGVYIAHSDFEKVQLQEYDPRFIQYKREGIDSLPQTIEYKGEEYSVYSQIIESSNWMVTLLRPVSDINRPLRNMTIYLIVLTIIVIFAVLLFSSFPRRNLARPLAGLTKLTRKISLGDYALGEIPPYKIQELDELGRSISQMSEEIMNREKAFRYIRTYLYNVLDSMPSIIIGIDLDLDVTQWNHRAEEETGLPAVEAVGKNLLKVFPRLKPSSNLIKKSIYRREMQSDTLRSYTSSVSKKVENLVIYPLTSYEIQGAVIRIDNVTEKTMMEETLIQNEKMLSVGGLAAGMAHEINNPLAGMVQTANVLSNRLGLVRQIPANEAAAAEAEISMESLKKYMEKRDIPYMIESLNSSGKRIAGIINNMLNFVRSNEDSSSTYNVNDILDQSIDLALTDYNLRKKYDFLQIRIDKEYGDDLPGVVCEKSRIQQVFFNILQNGAHAMASNKEETPRFTLKTYFESAQNMIVTEIIDNGPGMDESIRKRIFEPFFTTKPVGIGTGLGLSVSYFIITDNQNGQMSVESSPGRGAKFIIKLPVSS